MLQHHKLLLGMEILTERISLVNKALTSVMTTATAKINPTSVHVTDE